MKNIIVEVEDLSMAYNEEPVVWDIDLKIVENSRTAIVGPNGAGKSTLLKGILNLMKTLTGTVRFRGQSFKQYYKNIAYVPQLGSVNWDFPATVLDVVLMGRYVHLGWIKRPTKKDKMIAMEALERIGMEEFKNRQISELSGGQRQRVFLARAIASDAEIFFLDEPLQGVDIKSEAVIMDTIRQFQKDGKTIVAVHHDLNQVEEYFDHVAIINKRIIAHGPVSEVFTTENIESAYTEKRRM